VLTQAQMKRRTAVRKAIEKSRMRTQADKKTNLQLLALLLVGGTLAGVLLADDGVEPWVYAHVGLDHFYNLEYEQSLANFRRALELAPENPIFLNFIANAYLFQELYRTGQLDAQLYSESNPFLRSEKPGLDPNAMQTVNNLVARTKEICQQRLRQNGQDKTALYALGIAYGIEANYEFTVYKHWYAAIKAANKAKDYHSQLKKLDPDYHDANLVLGVYEYAVGSIPAAVKWLAFLVGYRGSKARGIELLHAAVRRGKLVTTDAAVLLAVIYNREKKYEYVRQLLHTLSTYYPRNHLLRLEIARTYLNEGNEAAALAEYRSIAAQVEANAPGYERVPRDRLYYQMGSLHQRQGDYEKALAAFEHITSGTSANGLLAAYSHLRKAEIYLAQNRLDKAREEYKRVLTVPYPEPRAQAERALKVLESRKQ